MSVILHVTFRSWTLLLSERVHIRFAQILHLVSVNLILGVLKNLSDIRQYHTHLVLVD